MHADPAPSLAEAQAQAEEMLAADADILWVIVFPLVRAQGSSQILSRSAWESSGHTGWAPLAS